MEFIAYLLIVTIISIVRSAPNQHHLIDNSDIKTFNYGNFQMRTKLTTFTLANGGIYGAVVDIVQVITDEAPKGFGSHVTTGTFAVEGVEHLPTVDQFLTDSYPLLNNLSLTPAHHGVFMISTKVHTT
jgi:hypothetical protein